MIPVWLYGADGRALYCVYVQVPMPRAVTYLGEVYLWSAKHAQYRRNELYPAQTVPAGQEPSEEMTAAATPPPPEEE